jgi:gliding motility-associated-like protein
MKKITLLVLLLSFIIPYSFSQSNVLVIDYNNNFSSDQNNNASNIYNRLVATQASVLRVNAIPATINPATYNQVWIFGDMGIPNTTTLNPIITYMNNGGAVYIQSEVSCCNNPAAFADQLIDATVIVGGSITHTTTKSGNFQYNAFPNLMCNPIVSYGAAVRPFQGATGPNILYQANNTCGGAIGANDVVGVKFCSGDMISGQGALIVNGDFNIFPSSGTCGSVGILGTPNNNAVIDLIADLLPALACDPNTGNPGTLTLTANPVNFCGSTQLGWTYTPGSGGCGPIGCLLDTTFLWQSIAGDPIIIGTNFSCDTCAYPTAWPSQPTTYTLTITIGDTNVSSCNTIIASVIPITVYPNTPPFADAGIDTTICMGASLILGGNPTGFGGNGGPYTYTWSPTTGLSNPTDPNPVYTPSGLGMVSFTVQVDDGSGCPPGFAIINVITISCCPATIANASTTNTSCSSVCDGSVIINVVDSATQYSIDGVNWTPNNTFNNLCAGNYTVYSTDGTCSDSVNITIIANPLPPTPTVVGPDSICSNNILTLTANGSGNGLISWYADANGAVLIDTGTVLNYTSSNSSGYITIYFSESSGNCESILGSFTVFVYRINAVINATPTSGILPLEVFFGNNSVGANYYFWSFGDGDTSTTFSPTHVYYNEGSYQAMLVATNGVCSDTTYITIEVSSVSSIFIPNVFTPNGDGSNDFFVVKSINLKSINGQILNRWGQTIFEWDDFNSHWNGKSSSGSLAPDGTYFYIINAEGNDGEIYNKKGSLSLIR